MIKTLKHLSYVLKIDVNEIESIISNIDKHYYQKEEIKFDSNGIPKLKNGEIQKRILNPSIGRFKEIQNRINVNVLQKLEIPYYAFGAIKGKDNIKNAKSHQGRKYIFTTDLKNYFPSIRHKDVFKMFISFGFSPTVARVLCQFTTYKGKVPQGAPTSSSISNLVFIKTGKKLIGLAREHNLVFTSFIDDLTFSSPNDFKNITNLILNAIVEDGYSISHKKTKIENKKWPILTKNI